MSPVDIKPGTDTSIGAITPAPPNQPVVDKKSAITKHSAAEPEYILGKFMPRLLPRGWVAFQIGGAPNDYAAQQDADQVSSSVLGRFMFPLLKET